MSAPPKKERRKTSRQACPNARLRVRGREVALVDWSFGGLGLRFSGDVAVMVSDEIDVDIFDSAGDRWETLGVVVRRIESGGLVGVEFKADDEKVEGIVIRLLKESLARVDNLERLLPSHNNNRDDHYTAYHRQPQEVRPQPKESDMSLSEVLRTEFE